MKILLLSSTNNIRNGYGNMTHELCMFLKGKIDFTLLLPIDEKRYEYVSYPVEYILPKYVFTTKAFSFYKYLFFTYKTDADVIHSVFEFPYSIIARRIARASKKPLIVGAAGTYAVKPLFAVQDGWFLRRVYNSAKTIIAISQFTADALVKYSHTTTPVRVIHAPVNFERFAAAQNAQVVDAIRAKYLGTSAQSGTTKILLTVGGLKPRKGQDVVLEALALLKKTRDDFHYLIVGDTEGRSGHITKLRGIIKRGGLESNVTFAGIVSDDELPAYFHACDMYVHTPVAHGWNFEGYGIVYLEAGAAHKPVIASNSGGTPDAVVADVTGLMVPENDPAATATAIARLLDDAELRAKLGAAGYEYAKAHTWETIGKDYLNIYNTI